MAMMAITTNSSINVNAASPVNPRLRQRASPRDPASFLFMALQKF
jgi:hypothetical protein